MNSHYTTMTIYSNPILKAPPKPKKRVVNKPKRKNPKAKLTDNQVLCIRIFSEVYSLSSSAIADRMGIDKTFVRRALTYSTHARVVPRKDNHHEVEKYKNNGNS